MSEGAKVAVGRGAIGKEVKHGGLIAGVEKARSGRASLLPKVRGKDQLAAVFTICKWSGRMVSDELEGPEIIEVGWYRVSLGSTMFPVFLSCRKRNITHTSWSQGSGTTATLR